MAPGLTGAYRLCVGLAVTLLLLVGASGPSAAMPDLAPRGWAPGTLVHVTLEPGVVTHTEVRTETVTETVTSTVGQGSSGAPEGTVGPPLVNEQPTLPTADPETVRSALPQMPGE